MSRNRSVTPINRNPIFFDDGEYELEVSFVEDYFDDINQSVILYSVDRSRTNINDIYKEAKTDTIKFLPPIELPCMYDLTDRELDSYDKHTGTGSYTVSGNLIFNILTKTLEDNKCDIIRGDYIAVHIDNDRLSYFTVVDDGKINNSNKHYIGVYKVGWRQVICSPAKEFNGK